MTAPTAGSTARPPARRRSAGRKGLIASVGIALVLAMFAAACGSSGRSNNAANNGGATATTAGPQKFGDMPSPCGPGNATGATQQGVTNDSITIGYGDDAGYPQAPGLNKEMSDAIKAMIDWCNQQGGINGRKVVGNYYDAKITDVNNVMTEACKQVFMLVGEGWSLDAAQEQTRLGCKLAAVPTYTVSPQFANGALMVQPTPNPADYMSIQNAYAMAQNFPEKVKKAAAMYGNYSATIDSTQKAQIAYKDAGWQWLNCDQEYNIGGEADWKPFLQKLKDCGAEIVYFSGSPNPNFENVLDAAAQIDYHPLWVEEANFYDSNFAKWNVNGNGDNVYVRMVFTPFEEANINPATQQYLDLIKASGGSTSLLGAQATAAFLLWAQGAQACGSNLTSDCVINNLKQVHSFTAGGLQAPADPGKNLPSDCGMVLKLDGTTYKQVFPSEEGKFDCNSKYLVQIQGPVVDRAHLNADRIAQPQ